MTERRIAHFSDAHIRGWHGVRPRQFLNKRWTGAANLALNRAKHYRVEVFERMLDAAVALEPDHTVCTGDLVNLALRPEFERVEGLLGARFGDDELTVIPGNHDYYVRDAVAAGLFEKHFGRWQPRDLALGDGAYPVVRLLDGLAIIGLCSGVATRVFMATGTVGETQRSALARALRDEAVRARFSVVLVHHPPRRGRGDRLSHLRRLTDAVELIDVLREGRPDLILNGHEHVFRRGVLPGTKTPVVQVASGSRLGRHPAELNLYTVRDGCLSSVRRHIYDAEREVFRPHDEAGRPLAAPAATAC